jgi:hypothetical protein
MTRLRRGQIQLQLIVRRAERDALVNTPAPSGVVRRGEPTGVTATSSYGDTAA